MYKNSNLTQVNILLYNLYCNSLQYLLLNLYLSPFRKKLLVNKQITDGKNIEIFLLVHQG